MLICRRQDQKMAIQQQESANSSELVEQARLQTTIGSGCLKAHIVSVALAKCVSHLPMERLLTSYPFRSATVINNAMRRPTIACIHVIQDNKNLPQIRAAFE